MKGEVVYLYAFDVANELVTSGIEQVLSAKPAPFDVQLDHTYPKDIPLYKPLAIQPPSLTDRLFGESVKLLVRLYDVGVVSITMRVPFERDDLEALLPFHNPVLESGASLDDVARGLCAEVCRQLHRLLVGLSEPSEPEAYTVFCISDLGPVRDVNQWLDENRRTAAGLLSETEPRRLSESQVAEAIRIRRSFESTDLVVIDWNAALLIDLSAYVDDQLYVLEMANLQLEEFRALDRTLDRYLSTAYDDLGRRRLPLLGGSHKILTELRRYRVDLARLTDEVTHITKFFGDWYLARVYLGAHERFHLERWRSSVEQRLAQLDQLYSVVNSELNERRMLWMELAIVVLFILDLMAIALF
ncbi:MAG: hypothetical protein HY000_10185 [Planctomycetes bacterium]|nr:hypothetical protein [Planctomycetota bacterium]